MVRDKKFSEEFWDADYIGSQGYDILVKKMKDGHKMCKDVEDFFKQRAKCEEDYAKNLQKLAKSSSNVNEMGTLRYAWDEMKSQVENIAQEHSDAAKQYLEEATRIGEFAEKHRTTRKTNEAMVSQFNKNKKDLYKRVLDCKRSYDSRCKESESQDKQIEEHKRMGSNTMMKPNDWEKLVVKQTKAGNDARHAERSYVETLKALEDTRATWQREMEKLCDEYERLEEVRLVFLRNELWVATNICSAICVEDDKHAESMRIGLEKIDADADILNFIAVNKTGQRRPGRIDFDPYISFQTNQPWSPNEQQQQPQSQPGLRPPQPLPNRAPPFRPGARYP